jgi:hypothetical protein
MPTEVVRAFSKRNQQITDHLALLLELGRQRTPALVRFAVHATRQAKRHEAPETLYDRWRAEALTQGIDPDRLMLAWSTSKVAGCWTSSLTAPPGP